VRREGISFKHTLPFPDLILGQSVKLMGL